MFEVVKWLMRSFDQTPWSFDQTPWSFESVLKISTCISSSISTSSHPGMILRSLSIFLCFEDLMSFCFFFTVEWIIFPRALHIHEKGILGIKRNLRTLVSFWPGDYIDEFLSLGTRSGIHMLKGEVDHWLAWSFPFSVCDSYSSLLGLD